MSWVERADKAPVDLCEAYGAEEDFFTLEIHHGGRMKAIRKRKVYDSAELRYFDFCDPDYMSLAEINKMVVHIGLSGMIKYSYREPGKDLSDGLRVLETERDVVEMLKWVPEYRCLELYLEKLSEEEAAKIPLVVRVEESAKSSVVIEEIESESMSARVQPCKKKRRRSVLLLEWHGGVVSGEAEKTSEGGVGVQKGFSGVDCATEVTEKNGRCSVDANTDSNADFCGGDFDGECGGNRTSPRLQSSPGGCDTQQHSHVRSPAVQSSRGRRGRGRDKGKQKVTDAEERMQTQTFSEPRRSARLRRQQEQFQQFELGDDHVGNLTDDSTGSEFRESDVDMTDDDVIFDEVVDTLSDRHDGDAGIQLGEEHGEQGDASTDCGVSDGFQSLMSEGESDAETSSRRRVEKPHYVQFRREVHMKEPQLVEGMVFSSADDFRDLVRVYSVFHGKPLYFKRNNKKLFVVKCRQSRCRFVLTCSLMQGKDCLQIKTLNPHHSCGHAMKNSNVKKNWLASHYLDYIRRTPNLAVSDFQEDIKDEFHVHVSYNTAWRAIIKAREMIDGNEVEQFGRLRDYGQEVMRTMPGSTVIIKCNDNVFEGIYICLAPLKAGFKEGLRRFVGVDGCFLKSAFKGQLLTAVGVDGNSGMYPLAWAVVDVENTDTWTWFIALLREDLGIEDPENWCFMSDQQKGLHNAINTEICGVEHRNCVRHLHNNWKKRHPGQTMKELMWACARSTNQQYFEANLQKIKGLSEVAFDDLIRYDAESWTRSRFRTNTKCDALLNNWCEAFNRTIIKARNKPIISMLCTISTQIMVRIRRKQNSIKNWNALLTPKVHKLLLDRVNRTKGLAVVWAADDKYQVTLGVHQFVVILKDRTCSCGLFQLTGVPCVHAVAAILLVGEAPESYVDDCYKTELYKRVYSHCVEPLNGPLMWRKSPFGEVLPPVIKRQPGRPKRARRRDVAEKIEARQQLEEAKRSSRETRKISKKGSKMHCKACKSETHNSRTCPVLKERREKERADAAATAQSQPSATNADHATASQLPDSQQTPDPVTNPIDAASVQS